MVTASSTGAAAAAVAQGPASGLVAWALRESRAAEAVHRYRWLVRLRWRAARRTKRAAFWRWRATAATVAAAAVHRHHTTSTTVAGRQGCALLEVWLSRRGRAMTLVL